MEMIECQMAVSSIGVAWPIC